MGEIKRRKVGIIGAGHVGAHTAYSIAIQGIADEIVFVDINDVRVRSEHQDLLDVLQHTPHRVRVHIGTVDDLVDCDVIVNSTGQIELLIDAGEDRSKELKFTVPAVHTWAHRLKKLGYDGVILSISNPCDVVAREIQLIMQLPKGRVLGTGTGLDTARLISQIAKKTDIDHRSIQAFMLGEHGNTMFAAWSCVGFNGMPLEKFAEKDEKFRFDKDEVEQLARKGGWVTFAYKHATEFSVGTTAARMVKAILHDERLIMPASTELNGEYGQTGVYTGVPCVIGRNGVEEIVELPLTEEELKKLDDSCNAIRANMAIADAMREEK